MHTFRFRLRTESVLSSAPAAANGLNTEGNGPIRGAPPRIHLAHGPLPSSRADRYALAVTSHPISSSRWVFAAAGVAVYVCLYFGVGLRSVSHSRSLATPVDALIPFWPIAIWVYASVYPAFLGPVLLVQSPARFRRIGWSLICVIVICVACFALFPVETASLRQSVPTGALANPSRSFTHWGIELLFALDPPRNAFPSLHVALATVISLGVGRSLGVAQTPSWHEPTMREATTTTKTEGEMKALGTPWRAYSWLAAVFVSVLLVRQHYVVDALAGLALGVLAYRVGVGHDGEPHAPGAFERRGAILLAMGVAASYAAIYAVYSSGYVPIETGGLPSSHH